MRPEQCVLVVEDDADFRDLVCSLLRESGAAPIAVANAEDAVDILASRPVEVVLCDYFLPGCNGVTFLRDVRARHPKVHCIAMTGHPDPFILARGHDDGYFVVTKPVDPALLLALVDGQGTSLAGAPGLPSEAAAHS